jgi:hypothetical protein
VTLAADSLNYVYVNSSGAVAASTSPPTGDYVPLAVADTGASTIYRIGTVRPFMFVAESGKNLLINPGFNHNFDAYPADGVATIANNVYAHSMWINRTGTTQIYSIDGSGNVNLGATELGQKNDDILAANGEQVVFSIQSGAVQIYGLGVTTWTTVTPGAPFTWVLGASGNSGFLELKKSGTSTFWRPKLERGMYPSPYVPRSWEEEGALCAPYMFKTYDTAVKPGSIDGYGRHVLMQASITAYRTCFSLVFPAPMRTRPTVSVYSPTTGTVGKIDHEVDGDIAAAAGQVSASSASVLTTAANTNLGLARAHFVADARYYT